MVKRTQLDHEMLKGLIEALHQNGVLSDDERAALLDRRDLDHAQRARVAFENNDGPPEFVKSGDRGGSP